MKMTGTKKFIIILLALACAIAAGLGILFGGSSGERLDTAQINSALAYEEENPDGENTGEEASLRDEISEEIEAEAEESEAEEEYDARYDEEAIKYIAEALDMDFATVSFYLHANELDADDIIARLEEDVVTASAVNSEEVTEEPSNTEAIKSEINAFGGEYRNGVVKLDEEVEDEDWFVAPDEVSLHYNYNNVSEYAPRFTPAASSSYNHSTNHTRYIFNVAPGQQVKAETYATYCVYLYRLYYANDHWAKVVNYEDWPDWYLHNEYVVTGDAPTGTVLTFYLDARSMGYSINGQRYWYYEIEIRRTNPPKPTLIGADAGTTNTKTVLFDGNISTISIASDYGACMLVYDLDSETQLIQRSQHGNEGTSGKYFIFGSTYTGRHEIIIRPNTAKGYKWSDDTTTGMTFYLVVEEQKVEEPAMQRDGNTVSANGKSKTVHANGGYLTVTFRNYDPHYMGWSSNGLDPDPASTVASNPANRVEGYDETNGTLTLRQNKQGSYTINIYLKNPEGCSWKNVGGTGMQQFYFYIKEEYIKAKPDMVEAPGQKTIAYNYTGGELSFTIKPALSDQLLVISAGIGTEPLDTDSDGKDDAIKFTMSDAGKASITVQPAPGFVWPDGSTTEINYVFIINPKLIDAPTLAAGEATEKDRVTKRVGFQPTKNWYETLTIENIPEDAINYHSALQKVSWTDDDVLVLKGSDALTYPVTFELISSNYQWKPTAALKTYYLQIDRYMLGAPHIIVSGDADKIVGDTKTVKFEDAAGDKFFKLYTGGSTSGNWHNPINQIQLDILTNIEVENKLEESFEWENSGAPELTLWGTNAANYIINITPTSNYCWDTTTDLDDPDTEMVTFKFVINAIQVDNVTMYTESGTGGWAPQLTREGFADYDGDYKYFRIGSEEKEGDIDKFIGESMSVKFVDEPVAPDSTTPVNRIFDVPGKVTENDCNNKNYVGILKWGVIHAGTYTVMLKLNNTDYCWRDGSGTEVYYTFTVKQQKIGTPTIIEKECGGNEREVWDNKYLDGVYDGNVFTLVIGIKNDEGLINIDLDPDGMDIDPDPETGVNGKGIWMYPLDGSTYNDRIVVQARNVGTHTVYLWMDSDSNYCWDEDVPGYEFQIRIDFAEITGVTFYYESEGKETKIGSDGSFYNDAEFTADTLQHLIVRRTVETEFADTPFKKIFTYEITANNGHVVTVGDDTFATDGDVNYSLAQLSLGLYHADSYLVKIFPTSNFKWKDIFFLNTPYTCFIQIKPKQVDLPLIVPGKDFGDTDTATTKDTIDNDFLTPTIKVTYNREYRTMDLSLGEDWKAFKVVYVAPGLMKDGTNTRDDHYIYRAIDAYTYELGISLSDDNNYQWDGSTEHKYYFTIQQRTVDVPDAYLVDCKDVSDWIAANKDKSIDPNDSDFNWEDKLVAGASATANSTVEYTKNAYRVYFYGEIVSKTRSGDTSLEVTITMSGFNASNTSLISYGEVAQKGVKVGYYCSATQVNKYTIDVQFRDNQFNVPNYQWGDNGYDTIRSFEFKISKMLVDIPVIDSANPDLDPDPNFAPNPDNGGAKNYAYFVYGKKPYAVTINNVLSSELMTYVNDNSLTHLGSYTANPATGLGSIQFSTIHAANVNGEYKLTLKIDGNNQRWNSTLPDGSPAPNDTDDKEFYIVINKLAVKAPEVQPAIDGSTDATNKYVDYNGSPYPVGTLVITDLDSSLMSYRLVSPLTTSANYLDAANFLEVGTTSPDAGKYSVVVSLGDPVNMKWDTTNGSENINLNLVIKPTPTPRPVIDTANSNGWYQDLVNTPPDNTPRYSDEDVTLADGVTVVHYTVNMDVTYNGNTHTLAIKNFNQNSMQAKVISSYKFANSYYDSGRDLLIYEAKNVGVYKIQITLSSNSEWDDGTGNVPITIVLTISKQIYDTPAINGYDDTKPAIYPNQFTKVVTYRLDSNGNGDEQWLEIENYNENIMTLWSVTSPAADKPFINRGVQSSTGYYRFGATHAGTYTVTFRLNDFTNNRWGLDYVEKETITFTFRIDKLELDIPAIDPMFILQGDTLTGGNTSLSATYDALGRAVLVNNVLGLSYMEYKPEKNYNTSGTTNFVYDSVSIADSSTDGGVTYPSIQTVLGYDSARVLVGYPGAVCGDAVNRQNYITMRATNTGTYTIVFTLNSAQLEDMVWSDGSITEKKVTLNISKMKVDAPTIVAKTGAVSNSDTSQTVKYTGKYIEFTVQNAFNGCKDLAEWNNFVATSVTGSYEYETHKVNSAVSTVSGAKLEVVSWFDGKMVLRAREVGAYSVTISIKDTNTTEWRNTSNTSRTLNFIIKKTEIAPTFSYSSTAPEWAANPSYASSSQWPISTPVKATITFNNICVRMAADGTTFEMLDLDVATEFYYIKDGTTLKNNIIISAPPADLVRVTTSTVSTIDPNWQIIENSGAYSLVYTYEIPHGADYISKGSFKLYAVQNGDNGNYKVNGSNKAFRIIADKAPFDETHIIWQYYRDDNPSVVTDVTYSNPSFASLGLTTWKGTSNASKPLELDYLEGSSYVFNAYLDTAYMAGFDGAGYTDFSSALLTYQVKWDGRYNGSQSATYTGTYSVNIKITAKDSEYYSFPDTTYTLYYKIKPVLYSLDGLYWMFDDGTIYDASYADLTNTYADGTNVYKYTFDGTAHTVKLAGTLPTGLTVSSYLVSGKDLNSQIYVGTYTTSFVFTTSNANYELPINDNTVTTYTNSDGLFVWEVTWEIVKAELEVEWEEKRSEDGSSAYVPVLKEHGEMVDYTYYKDTSGTVGAAAASGSWADVTSFEHDAGGEWFKVEANLKTSSNPALNYANNYDLVFVTKDASGTVTSKTSDNWKEFLLKGDSVQVEVYLGAEYVDDGTGTGNMVYVSGSGKKLVGGTDPNDNKFSYTGDPFLSYMNLIDTTGTLTLANVVLTYYSSVNYNKPLTEVPVNAGTYKVKLTLVNLPDNGKNYQLADREFYFLVDKGVFDGTKIYWQYTHEDVDGNHITAKWVEMGTDNWLWQITEYLDNTGTEVAAEKGKQYVPTYDGLVHTVKLVSEDTRLKINNKNDNKTDAGDYTTTATFAYESKKWYSPVEAPLNIVPNLDWTVEKKEISLVNIKWVHTCEDNDGDPCIYTVSGGVAKKHSAQLDESTFDHYLLDYISYKTYIKNTDGTKGKEVGNLVSDAGTYITECIIAEFPENSNFKVGKWPDGSDGGLAVPEELEWEVLQRAIVIPTSVANTETGYWTVYDGLQHDLLAAIDKQSDWSEYYTIAIKYAQHGAIKSADYDGTKAYGYKYTAVNAGTYTYTFTIAKDLNTKDVTNVVWRTNDTGSSYTPSTADQSYDLVVAKAAMNITGWNDNRETSTVNFTGDHVSEHFIDYRFFRGTTPGTVPNDVVSVDAVLNSPGGEDFVIEPYIKDEYAGNIELTFDSPSYKFLHFISRVLSSDPDDQLQIPKEIFISGYRVGGVTHTYSDDEWKAMMKEQNIVPGTVADDDATAWAQYLTPAYKAQTKVFVTYGGDEVTFILERWTYYQNHLTIWKGNLTQKDAGDYSVTLVLKQDDFGDTGKTARCWTIKDGVIDRAALTLNFQLRYKMLTVPELKEVTYTGAEYENIIRTSFQIILDDVDAGDKAYDDLIKEYGDYVTVTGVSGTAAGSYRLYLTIKDEYINTIRWYNNTAFGQPGTLTIDWKILPIYIVTPTLSKVKVVYDGEAHSVKEALVGFSADCTDEEKEALEGLMQNARISSEGSMGVNAGKYTATFSLPDSNYAWKDASTGNVDLEDRAPKPIEWTISPKPLNMKDLYWGYYDEDGNPVKADVIEEDGKAPRIEFVYTYVDGEPFEYTLQLLGISEELEDFIAYGIGNDYGNTRSEVGTYVMWVTFFSNAVDKANYDVDSIPLDFLTKYKPLSGGDGDLEVTWQIKPRQFTVPEDKEMFFDGDVHDLLEILGFGSEWENYFDVSVEYKELDETDDQFKDYMDKAEIDDVLGYSIYNVYYLGDYRVNLYIKSEMNDADHNRVVWLSGGNTFTSDTSVTVTVNPITVTANGWNDAEREWEITVDVSLPEGISLSDLPADIFDYVIREYNGEDGEPGKEVTAEDIENNGSGFSYAIEFVINPKYEYALNSGAIILDFDTNGIENPKIFGVYDFGEYSDDKYVFWIPIPEIEDRDDGQSYTAEELTIRIKNWVNNYLINDAFKKAYPKYFTAGADIMDSFVYTTSSSIDSFDTATGEIKATKAGEYKVALRLNPKLNLSWYDPALYNVNASGKLVKKGETEPVADTSSLIYRYAKTISFTINKMKVRLPDIEWLESMLPSLEYNGLTYNLKDLDQCKAFFAYLEREYGNLVTVTDGYTGSLAGVHELILSLTDEESSYWDLNEKVTETVKEEGYVFAYKRINGSWVLKYVHENDDGTFTDYNGGNYTINRVYQYEKRIKNYVLITDGLIDELGNITDLDNVYNTNPDGSVIRYKKLDDGTYEVAADGTYVAILEVDANGDPVLRVSVDKNYNPVIDSEKSEVVVSYDKQSTEPVKVNWYITYASRTSPYAKTEGGLVFNGTAQSAADALDNFDPNIMEIIEDATGVNAGEYTAKIVFKDENYVWADTEEDYVLVKWYIAKATFDLTGVTWSYTEDTEFIYTIKNNKPVVHSVELLNLPDAVKNSIRYTTNNTVGAHAGVNAGRYFTTFEILNLDENFSEWTLPEDMQSSLTWYIQKRVLELPEIASTWVVFDDEAHNLLDFLDLAADWNEYFEITITYSDGKSPFTAYNGYDLDGVNGIDDVEKYYAYGAGTYRYYFSIKSGINTTGANVVWHKV